MVVNNPIVELGKYGVICPNCQKESPLKSWGFVQTFWHEGPRGCHEGDNWWANKDIMQCLLVCPNNCAKNGKSLAATRIMELPIEYSEKEYVFGLIQQVTDLQEPELNKIFIDHYVQYGTGEEIESSKEWRKKLEEIDI